MIATTAKPHVLHLVKLLNYVTQRNEKLFDSEATIFHSLPGENEILVDFMRRLDDNIRCSEACYATALVYVDRITETNPDLNLNYSTVQKLFATSLLVANQFMDDTSERTLQFARVTGIHPLLMANLKTEFLFRIQFRLHATPEEIKGYSDKLQGRYSTEEFAKQQHWDGTPQAELNLQVSQILRASCKAVAPVIRAPSSNKIPPPLPERTLDVKAKKAPVITVPLKKPANEPRKLLRYTRSQSDGLTTAEMVTDLASMGMDSLVV